MKLTSSDAQLVLRKWIVGARIVGFEFRGAFQIFLERGEAAGITRHTIIQPGGGALSVSDGQEWEHFWRSMPLPARRTDPDEPALAYWLMLANDATIVDMRVKADGSMVAETSDQEIILISGVNSFGDVSWSVRNVPPSSPEKPYLVECNAAGEIWSNFELC